MKKILYITTLMFSCSLAAMARAADTSKDNCEAVAGVGNCVQIVVPGPYSSGYSGTYYSVNDGIMTIYGPTESGSTVASVPNQTFVNNYTWKSTLPVGVTSLKISGNVDIGSQAFYGAGLTSIDMTGVQTIGSDAFMETTGLTSINLTGVQTIETWAFYHTGLTSVDLTGVQTIKGSAFYNATNLTSIVISDSLLDAGGNISGISSTAFKGTGLNAIYCPVGKTCANSFEGLSSTPTIFSYNKNGDGTYTVGDNTYANSDMMTKNITCEGAQCTALRTALNAGNTCSTQEACNALATQYATDDDENPTSQPTKPARASKRIYTIDEANQVAGKTNTFTIRYR